MFYCLGMLLLYKIKVLLELINENQFDGSGSAMAGDQGGSAAAVDFNFTMESIVAYQFLGFEIVLRNASNYTENSGQLEYAVDSASLLFAQDIPSPNDPLQDNGTHDEITATGTGTSSITTGVNGGVNRQSGLIALDS